MKTITLAILTLALIALTGCATIPTPLQNLALEADVSAQIAGSERYGVDGINYHGGHVGRVALVLDQPVTRSFQCRFGVEHRSLLDTGRDRGEERAFAGFTWRLFAGGRP